MEDTFDRWKLQIFSGFRLRDRGGLEFKTRSRHLIDLITFLALQTDCSYSRHSLASIIFDDGGENVCDRLTVLLSRAVSKLNERGGSFLQITGDAVWLDLKKIDIDLLSALSQIEHIADEAFQGRPVSQSFEALGSMIGSLDVETLHPIVSSSIDSAKSRFRHLILSRLVPAVGINFSASVSSIVEILGLEIPESATSCCQMMAIYSGIGDIGAVHRVFARHEDALEEEFGEIVSHSTLEAFSLASKSEPQPGHAFQIDTQPPDPLLTVGLDGILERILGLVGQSRKGDVIQIIGSKGAGKSHCLSFIHKHLDFDHDVMYIDMDYVTSDWSLHDFSRTEARVLLVDNFKSDQLAVLTSLVGRLKVGISVVATERAIKLPNWISILLPKLTVGTELNPGTGILLARNVLGDASEANWHHSQSKDFRTLAKLIEATGGYPLALIAAVQMAKYVGLKASLEFVEADLGALSKNSLRDGTFSLRKEILTRIGESLPTQQKGLKILSRLKGKVHPDHLISAGQLSHDLIDDYVQIGFVEYSTDQLICLLEPVRRVIDSTDFGVLDPSDWSDFCMGSSIWLRHKTESISDHLNVAQTMSSFEEICSWLLSQSNAVEGLQTFSDMTKWMPDYQISLSLTAQAESALLGSSEVQAKQWCEYITAICRGYFFNAKYTRVLELCRWILSSTNYLMAEADIQYRIINLKGLAHRCLSEFDLAQACFSQALSIAPTSDSKVTLRYNLGCLDERQGRLDLALQHFEAALLGHTPNTDRRLVAQITTDVFRLRRELFPDEYDHAELFQRLFCDSAFSTNKRAQSVLLCDLGEIKFEQGALWEGAYYMALGIFQTFEFGYNLNSISVCRPTLETLVMCVRELGLIELHDYLSICLEYVQLVYKMGEAESSSEKSTFFSALMQVLMSIFHVDREGRVDVPEELNSFYEESYRTFLVENGDGSIVTALEQLRLLIRERCRQAPTEFSEA